MPGRSADDHAAPSGAAHRAGRTIPRVSPVAKFVASFRDDSLLACCLAAPARRPAAHAPVAASVPHHDGSARRAARRVAHLVHVAHRVRRMINAAVLHVGPWPAGRSAPSTIEPRAQCRRRDDCARPRCSSGSAGSPPPPPAWPGCCCDAASLFRLGLFENRGRSRQLRRPRSQPRKQRQLLPGRKRRFSQRKM